MADLSGEEIELVVADSFHMLLLELPGASPNTANPEAITS